MRPQGYSLKKTIGFGKHPMKILNMSLSILPHLKPQVDNLENRVNILEEKLTIVVTQKKLVVTLLEDQERSSIQLLANLSLTHFSTLDGLHIPPSTEFYIIGLLGFTVILRSFLVF